MERRRFLLTSLTGALLTSRGARAQAFASMVRIGVLTIGSADALRQSLRELGYADGRNIVLEIRDTQGRADRVVDLAAELARLKVTVIVGTYPAAVIAARRATATIPIVMVHTPDPVDLGLVTSLSRPGGNITGVTSLSINVSVKQIELLSEAVPQASRIAMLWNPDSPWHSLVVKAFSNEQHGLGVRLQMLQIRTPEEFAAAFHMLVQEQADAALALADPMMFAHRARLADLGLRHRIPLMGGLRGYTEAGCLMSYWADADELYRRAATYVDRILKGASPAVLPVEQPTMYRLVINMKTAKALGLTIPPSLLLRADQVIE